MVYACRILRCAIRIQLKHYGIVSWVLLDPYQISWFN